MTSVSMWPASDSRASEPVTTAADDLDDHEHDEHDEGRGQPPLVPRAGRDRPVGVAVVVAHGDH